MHTQLFYDAVLAQRLEQAEAATTRQYVATRAALRPEAGCISQTIGDGVALFAGEDSPINRVVALGMTQPATMLEIEACIAFYTARREQTRIDLCPLAQPPMLDTLRQAGYSIAQFKHVLVRTLAEWPDQPVPASTINVRPILAAEAELWALTVTGAFRGEAYNSAALEVALPNPYKPDTVCFLAWVEGQPIGGGALAIQDDVAILP